MPFNKCFELVLSSWYPKVMLLFYSLSQLYPHIVNYGRIDASANTLKFCLSRSCSAGQECCLSYGDFSSSHLVTFYGFVPQGENPCDVILLGKFYYSIMFQSLILYIIYRRKAIALLLNNV